MKKIEAIIEKNADGEYSVYCVDEMFSGMGATAEEAKADMLGAMKTMLSLAKRITTNIQLGSMANIPLFTSLMHNLSCSITQGLLLPLRWVVCLA